MDNPVSGTDIFPRHGHGCHDPIIPWWFCAFQNMLSREAKQKSDSRNSRVDFDISVEW